MTWHLVTTEYPPMVGGIATWAAGVARALRAAGDEVVVHARGGGDVRMRGRSWRTWQGVWAALSVRPRLRPGDRILCATWPLAVRLVGLGHPVGVCYHGSDLTRPPPIPGLDEVKAHAVHLPVSDYLGGLLGVPYTRLPVPIDPLPTVERGDALLTIARPTPLKGVERVVAFGARLGRPVVVVGDPPTPDIPWSSRAVCLFSRPDADGSGSEGLGLVLLEAAARGLPTLGTATGGIPEAADHVIDPERDDLPEPLPADVIHDRLAARHGAARCVEVLRVVL